jgi:hypothetical protein
VDNPCTSGALQLSSLVSTWLAFILYQELFVILELTRDFIRFIYMLACARSGHIASCDTSKLAQKLFMINIQEIVLNACKFRPRLTQIWDAVTANFFEKYDSSTDMLSYYFKSVAARFTHMLAVSH